MKIMVLGAGRVGSAMVADLVKDRKFKLTVADINPTSLKRVKGTGIRTVKADLSNPDSLKNLVSGADLVLNAVPGFMGYSVFKAVIEAGIDIVDIAFFPEDPLPLDSLAKKKGVTAIMDCGVAPGMSNLLIGHVNRQLQRLDMVKIFVGGLPVRRNLPFEYRAVFSPIDVIEEYVRPARYRENDILVVKEALSDPEYLDFQKVGTVEAFNTDGLRTLLETIPCPNMTEKTLRYPGHVEKMRLFRETGFFRSDPVHIDGKAIRPIDVTSRLLFPLWELAKGEEDLTLMRILIEGYNGTRQVRYTYELFDRYDVESKTTSMARTTGYTATMAVRLLAAGLFPEKGVFPPEFIGKYPDCVSFIMKGLEDRNIRYQEIINDL